MSAPLAPAALDVYEPYATVFQIFENEATHWDGSDSDTAHAVRMASVRIQRAMFFPRDLARLHLEKAGLTTRALVDLIRARPGSNRKDTKAVKARLAQLLRE